MNNNIFRHHFVGAAEFIVGDLVTANGQKLVIVIEDKNGDKLAKNVFPKTKTMTSLNSI